MKKIFTAGNIRELQNKVERNEISYSKMIEVLNEMASIKFDKKQCCHPLSKIMFWNNGSIECSVCGYKINKLI